MYRRVCVCVSGIITLRQNKTQNKTNNIYHIYFGKNHVRARSCANTQRKCMIIERNGTFFCSVFTRIQD